MSHPYDASTKYLVQTWLADWLPLCGRTTTAELQVINADLATVTAAADRVLLVREDPPWLLHLELQASRDDDLLPNLPAYNMIGYRKTPARDCSRAGFRGPCDLQAGSGSARLLVARLLGGRGRAGAGSAVFGTSFGASLGAASGAGGFWQRMQVLHLTVKTAFSHSRKWMGPQPEEQPLSQPQALLPPQKAAQLPQPAAAGAGAQHAGLAQQAGSGPSNRRRKPACRGRCLSTSPQETGWFSFHNSLDPFNSAHFGF